MRRVDAFLRDRRTGRLVLFQVPNPALWVFIAATVLRWSPWDERDHELLWLGRGALMAWALDELVRGDAPVRRVLGVIVLVWQVAALVT